MTAEARKPLHRDPLATYDALGRKQPKGLGLIELLRGVPGLLGVFDKVVPPEFYARENDAAIVTCSCGVPEKLTVPFNRPVHCEGVGCHRWFFYDTIRVRVAREPDPPTEVVH